MGGIIPALLTYLGVEDHIGHGIGMAFAEQSWQGMQNPLRQTALSPWRAGRAGVGMGAGTGWGTPTHSLTEEVAHSGQLHIKALSGDMVIQSEGSGASQTCVGIPAPPLTS